MKSSTLTLVPVALLLFACAQSRLGDFIEPLDDAAVSDAREAWDSGQADSGSGDTPPGWDVGVPINPLCPPIPYVLMAELPPNLGGLTDSEAECLGIDAPECMGCHTNPIGSMELWPSASSHPRGLTTRATTEECGVYVDALDPEVACCMGLTQSACVGCHTANGEVFVRPFWDVTGLPSEPAIGDGRSLAECL